MSGFLHVETSLARAPSLPPPCLAVRKDHNSSFLGPMGEKAEESLLLFPRQPYEERRRENQ